MTPEIVVVIPTLNEEAGIGWVLDRVHETLKALGRPYHIVVVDGWSRDKTVEIAKSKGAEVVMQEGRGYGAAYIQGFSYVVKRYSPRIIVMLDADGTYDPAEMPKLLKPIEEGRADMVIGNRFAGMLPGAMGAINKIGNKALSWLARVMIGIDVRDTQSGYRAMTREVVEVAPLTDPGMPFATELIVEAYAHGFKIAEVPITYRPRLGGQSKLNPLKDGYRILKTIVRFALRYNPLFFATAAAALLTAPGLALGAYSAAMYLTGVKTYVKALAAIALTAAGINAILMALLALYLKRMEYRIIRMMRLSMRKICTTP